MSRWLVVLVMVPIAGSLLAGTGSPTEYSLRKVDPALVTAAARAPRSTLPLIIRETMPDSDAAEQRVIDLGGTVERELPIMGGFSASLPASALSELARSDAIGIVWGDAQIQTQSTDTSIYDSWDPNAYWRKAIRLGLIDSAYNGTGVTVAILDTGVGQVSDLGNRVLARVDLTPDHDGEDYFGHGTHLSGIIAGSGAASDGRWRGVAPRSRLVSVKVARADGSTDVSVVIAGLQWVAFHRSDYNIRVLNLAFGTDGQQSYSLDPLDYAVEQVWFAGVLVVVSAGNRGSDAGTINKPADDPFVLTVGAVDVKGTAARDDDVVAPFSSRGPTHDGFRKPDLVAPGITIVSARVPGSTIDELHPLARVGDSYFKGTGTSQAAAIVSGVAALMFQANPSLTPDVAKATLKETADMSSSLGRGAGDGLLDAYGAVKAALNGKYVYSPANVGLVPSTGLGLIEASRGSLHVNADLDGDGRLNDVVKGEIDALGMKWSSTFWGSTSWSSLTSQSSGWDSTSWSSTSWSGTSWSSTSWSSTSWSSLTWS
ncbi:MAG: S8 family peptidase [Actinomycetota bacterium]